MEGQGLRRLRHHWNGWREVSSRVVSLWRRRSLKKPWRWRMWSIVTSRSVTIEGDWVADTSVGTRSGFRRKRGRSCIFGGSDASWVQCSCADRCITKCYLDMVLKAQSSWGEVQMPAIPFSYLFSSRVSHRLPANDSPFCIRCITRTHFLCCTRASANPQWVSQTRRVLDSTIGHKYSDPGVESQTRLVLLESAR